MSDKRFYVYVDWTNEEIPRPFYVGKGTGNRIKKQLRNGFHKHISKLYGCQRRIEFETEDETIAFTKEIELIAVYKTYNRENCELGANFTRGGNGNRFGHKHTEQVKEAYRSAAKKRAADPTWCQKMSDVLKERWKDPVYREKFSQATSGRKRTNEQRKRMSENHNKSEDTRALQHEAALKRFECEEEREKISKSIKNLWLDPEYRQRMIVAQREGRLRKKFERESLNE